MHLRISVIVLNGFDSIIPYLFHIFLHLIVKKSRNSSVPKVGNCILFSIYFYLVSGMLDRKDFFLLCHSNMSVNLCSCDGTVSQ